MKTIFGLANNEKHADQAVSNLMHAGFSENSISILYPDKRNAGKNMDMKKGTNGKRDTLHENENAQWKSEHSDGTYEKDRSSMDYKTSENKPKKHGSLATEAHTKAPEGGATGATAGGLLGGTLGLLAGIGALAIPGVGPFIAAGPLMAALSGSALGGSLGLLLGALVGYGIPEYEAKMYESGLKEGKILMSVEVKNDNDIEKVKKILEKAGLTDISSATAKANARH